MSCEWGTHADFASIYEEFLDAVYPPQMADKTSQTGRWKLMRSIAAQMRDREVRQVLDCAAGTGFPSLDLVADATERFEIHCSDGDGAMVAVLARRASELGVAIERLAPRRWPSKMPPTGLAALVIDWARLNHVEGRYDYVLCRGNSLAYADTWTGRRRVSSEAVIETYLRRMADRIRPGGHLHVDAPWTLELPTTSYRSLSGSAGTIWEQVTAEQDCREWWLSFKPRDGGRPLTFKRYSSHLTIDRVEAALKALGFEETAPFQLAAERPGFGTIIALKPRTS